MLRNAGTQLGKTVRRWKREEEDVYSYKVIQDCSSMDGRFHLDAGEIVTGNGNFVGKVGVLKDGIWDLVERDALQRIRSGVDRRQGMPDRRAGDDRRS